MPPLPSAAVASDSTWPSTAGWLTPTLAPLNKLIVLRAFHDVGICEIPPGSNRSGRIDEYVTRAGSPLGSYWCAAWATAVWEDCHAALPRAARASNDVLRDWAEVQGSWRADPIEGAFVLYGTRLPGGGWKTLPNGKPDAVHIGIVIRRSPYLIAIEGNAAWSGFSSNGEAVLAKRIDTQRVLGYVHPSVRS